MEALEARIAELERKERIRELRDCINHLELLWMNGGGQTYIDEANKLRERLKHLTPFLPEEIQVAMRAKVERMEGDNKAKLREYFEGIGVKFDSVEEVEETNLGKKLAAMGVKFDPPPIDEAKLERMEEEEPNLSRKTDVMNLRYERGNS